MKIFSKKTLYVISSFLTGFAVMTIELTSSRIVAPIIGSSVFTWTSVIGVTLLGLALGSYLGGYIADRKDEKSSLSSAFLISSVVVSLIPIFAWNADFITNSSDSILKLNLYLSIYLFLLPAFALGMIQPIILKNYADDFSKIGSEYGILSTAWSSGGILGVFLTGFFFISNIGSRQTIWLMSLILVLIGLIFAAKNKKVLLFFVMTILIAPTLIYNAQQKAIDPRIVFQKETNYYNAKVIDSYLPSYGNSRMLFLDFDLHSIQSEKEAQNYTEIYPIFSNLKKNIHNILAIGAGGYIMPKHFKDYYKDADVSVIEIDGTMIDIANSFFGLEKYSIQTIVGDAKIVIKKTKEKYDLIFGDAYNSFISVPWYLLTEEWNEEIKDKLNANGIYAINFIGSIDGEKSEFAKSVIHTFETSFPNFYIFVFGGNATDVQNIVLVGIKGELPIGEEALYKKLSAGENGFLADKIMPKYLIEKSTSIILTDNFSPVEKLMEPAIKSYFPKRLH